MIGPHDHLPRSYLAEIILGSAGRVARSKRFANAISRISLRETLKFFPRGLDATYERILTSIDEIYHQDVDHGPPVGSIH
jgi:hypothetical protein